MTHRAFLASPADIDGVVAIARKNVDSLGFLPRGGWIESAKKGEMLVAKDAETGSVDGFLQFHAKKDRTVTVYKYAVDERSRGQGIGTLLMNCLHDIAKRRHWHSITLKVVEGTPACGFYESRGFAVVGKEKSAKRFVLAMKKNVRGNK